MAYNNTDHYSLILGESVSLSVIQKIRAVAVDSTYLYERFKSNKDVCYLFVLTCRCDLVFVFMYPSSLSLCVVFCVSLLYRVGLDLARCRCHNHGEANMTKTKDIATTTIVLQILTRIRIEY